ncbi:MAG: hypothetical protein GW898_10770 [Thiomicrospira sp.]|nr:hypothetical protein [Thiomicrospira sp.]NCN66386.1 hypothetical protein [Thiomicrospira sp.]NCO14840.1 hypothetical protein [Thiomicrospira sp.]NCO82436.1 hypothetical protein [Thiomicrospira sp.]OIP95434.1 MAG: hypothetical protein AUK56_05185 [Thiomicrospira sp. CG2_30_44_34]
MSNQLATTQNQNTQMSQVQVALVQNKEAISSLLPSHLSFDKFMQVALIASMHNPDLNACIPSSLVQAFSDCAKDGLIPDNKEAAIVIYNSKRGSEWVKKAQYQPMIDGVLKKIRQSGEITRIDAKIVYQDDAFDFYTDLDGDHLIHKPSFLSKNRSNNDIVVVYATAKTKKGEVMVEVMTKEDIDRIMYNSKGTIDRNTGQVKSGSVWSNWYDRMALKSALHRLGRRLPNSAEVMEMLERDIQMKSLSEQAEDAGASAPKKRVGKKVPLDAEKVKNLQDLVKATNSDEQIMFKWVSSQIENQANSYQDLNNAQYDLLVDRLEGKMAKAAKQQSLSQAGGQAQQAQAAQ